MIGKVSAKSGVNSASSYASFPALKHFIVIEGGSGTYEAVDPVGDVRLLNTPWTATSPHSGYMNVLNETIHHNIALANGTWTQPDRKSSIWLICGKFDGSFSFGFGDSTPNNVEVVLTQAGTTSVLAIVKFRDSDSINVPDISSSVFTPSVLDVNVTSMCGFIINEETQKFETFLTDTNGDFGSAERDMADYPDYPGCNFPATYSMGRDFVTSGIGTNGIDDMSGIAVFEFDNGIPDDYQEAIEWMRTQWAIGRKAIWPAWEGIN